MASEAKISELSNLRLYLEECLKRADPTIDTNPGSTFDTEVITPLIKRMSPDPFDTPIRDFILGRLKSEFPALIIQDGDPIDDLVVKPMQILLEPYRRQIQFVSLNQSLQDPSVLSDEEADSLGANFFVNRRQGGFSIGIGRLYYTSPQACLITPSNAVVSADGLRFLPVENQAIDSDTMRLNLEAGIYYFDVVLRAESEGSEFNIAIASLVSIEGMPSVVKVTNKSAFEEGADRETTEEYVGRIATSLSEKSLVTTRGINARLLESFGNVRRLTVIGFGDPEMERDIVTAADLEAQYTFGMAVGSVQTGNLDRINVSFIGSDSGATNLAGAGFEVGCILRWWSPPSNSLVEKTVTEVSGTYLYVEPPFTTTFPSVLVMASKPATVGSSIRLANIPGGILVPTTPYGDIEIAENQVHIGGMLDVFIRAGFPQQRGTTLEAIRDAEPLHFGIDLESFGEADKKFCAMFELSSSASAYVIADGSEEIHIFTDAVPPALEGWPDATDVDRFIELRVAAGGNDEVHCYKISGVEGRFWDVVYEAYYIKITIERTTDYAQGSLYSVPSNEPAKADWYWRLRDQITITDIVRDRDNSNNPAGVDFVELGAEVGDSIVVETGDDADIYTIRRIFSSISDEGNDALLLSQDLTKTVTPSGSGGLRYRLADELDVDLVKPRTTKLPLGNIFEGGDLNLSAGSRTGTVSGTTNFVTAGVVVGDVLEVLSGDNAGIYSILAIAATSVSLDPAPNSTTFGTEFTVYQAFTPVERPFVRVQKIELLDSSQQTTGIEIPYGNAIDARILGTLSNRAQGTLRESYTGATSLSPATRLTDAEAKFETLGVTAGCRLVVYEEDNEGEYTIKNVVSETELDIYPATEGGVEFISVKTNVHYRVGVASVGYVRLYFLDPTSASVITGLAGGRLEYREGDIIRAFRFSQVDGRLLFPAAITDETPRDLRVLRSVEVSPGPPAEYETNVELTDGNNPDVYELELLEGDVLEAQHQIWWKGWGGVDLMFAGDLTGTTIYAGFPAIHTTIGSNLVQLDPDSLVAPALMNVVGQTLYIEDGPDAGRYIIEGVNVQTLQLSQSMKSTTTAVLARGSTDASLSDDGGTAKLNDPTNPPGATSAKVGDFITIYEVTDPENKGIAGTWEIESIPDAYNVKLIDCPAATVVAGKFRWFRTSTDEKVRYQIRIYDTISTQYGIKSVAPVDGETSIRGTGTISDVSGDIVRVTASVAGAFAGVEVGDLIEIVHSHGGNNGQVRTIIETPSTNYVHVATTDPFPNPESSIVWRVWGGIHGNRKSLRLESFGESNGLLPWGEQLPYTLRRPAVGHISSTDMKVNFDGTLYFMDLQIESMGAGDYLNLAENLRMVVTAGLSVDGYTYRVENNVLTFSPYEQLYLKFDRRFLPVGNSDLPENMTEISGRNLKIDYDTSTTTRVIDDLLHSDTERPINANPIARHFLPSYLFTTLTYRGGAAAATVGQEVEDYVNNLGNEELEVSDLEKFLTRRGATFVQHPIELVSVTHDLNRELIVDRTQNAFGVAEVPFKGTARTTSFFAYLNEGLNVVRES